MVILFSLIAAAFAADIQIHIPNEVLCSEALERTTIQARKMLQFTLPLIVPNSNIEAVLTTFPNLRAGLRRAGSAKARVDQILRFSDQTRARAPLSPGLRVVEQQLKRVDFNPGLLYFCVLPESCLTNSFRTAAHLKGDDVFAISSFDDIDSQLHRLSLGKPNPRRTPHLIFLQDREGQDELTLVEALYDTLSRFAQWEVTHAWVEANQRRQRIGESADSKFKLFTRVTHAQILELDEGFHRVLLESRASAARFAFAAQTNIMDDERLAAAYAHYSDSAMRAIGQYGAVTRKVVAKYGLNQKNILEFGDNTAREMLATIESSPSP